MRLFKAISILMLVPSAICAQDFGETVIPLGRVRPGVHLQGPRLPGVGMGLEFGTGFCLDRECRFVATNYHIAELVRPRKIKGERILQTYLATGPHDRTATPKQVSTKMMAYAVGHDLAIFELGRPLAKHRGIAYSLEELTPGQSVDIYAYPLQGMNPFRKLLRFQGTFKAETTSGLLAFDYAPADGQTIRGGASGGLIVESKTQKVVGILSEVAASGEPIALAVPVRELAEFTRKVCPYLAPDLFPLPDAVPPMSADLYPKFVPSPGSVLSRRADEPADIQRLREVADQLVENMKHFVALQTFAWGRDREAPSQAATYETQVIDGVQKFTKYQSRDGDFVPVSDPASSGWVLPADEWSSLPKMVGTDLRLKIRRAPDIVADGVETKVFQYYASAEDNLCPFETVDNRIFYTVRKSVVVACYGEVWTDAHLNIVRISENLDLSDNAKAYQGWEAFRVVVTYDWLPQSGEVKRRVPLTIFTEAQDRKHVYWCRGQFADYRRFQTASRIVTAAAP